MLNLVLSMYSSLFNVLISLYIPVAIFSFYIIVKVLTLLVDFIRK